MDEAFCFTSNKRGATVNWLDMRRSLLDEPFRSYYSNTLLGTSWLYILSTRLLSIKTNINLEIKGSSEIRYIQKLGGHNLTRPLELRISYRADHVFVDNEELNLWGEGSSLEEAEKSFEDFFLHDFKIYKKTPAKKMDFSAREKLKAYKNLLKIC
jgi:hypothetical protein